MTGERPGPWPWHSDVRLVQGASCHLCQREEQMPESLATARRPKARPIDFARLPYHEWSTRYDIPGARIAGASPSVAFLRRRAGRGGETAGPSFVDLWREKEPLPLHRWRSVNSKVEISETVDPKRQTTSPWRNALTVVVLRVETAFSKPSQWRHRDAWRRVKAVLSWRHAQGICNRRPADVVDIQRTVVWTGPRIVSCRPRRPCRERPESGRASAGMFTWFYAAAAWSTPGSR